VDAFQTPLVDCFRVGGDAPRDVRMLAACGGIPMRAGEQLTLLMILVADPDPEVAATAEATLARLPSAPLAAFLAGPDVPADLREFFATRRPQPGPTDSAADAAAVAGAASPDPLALGLSDFDVPEPVDAGSAADADAGSPAAGDTPADIEADPERRGAAQRLAMLSVAERMKVAMQGSREERSILIRDPNRLVSSAVLSSPKLTESEVEAISRMTNVSVDVLRTVGTSRVWLKSYSVVASLTRNAKTPIAVALTLLNRLTERDAKVLSTDRNIPEPVRLAARKIVSRGAARRQ
jgi:hypothetical protein